MTHPARDDAARRHAAGVAIVAAYATVVGLLLARHDAWRDEAQLWLIGVASDTPADLFRASHQEVRPLTWFMITWLLSRLTTDFRWLQVLNWLVSVGTAIVVVWYWPLRRLEQIAVLGGMLFLLGYATVSEDYMLGTLCLALVLAGLARRWSPVAVILLVGLLGSINFLFSLLAVGLLVGIVVSWTRSEAQHLAARSPSTSPARLAASLVAAISAIVVSVATAYPTGENVWRRRSGYSPGLVADRILRHTTEAIVPWVDTQRLEREQVALYAVVTIASVLAVVVAVALAWLAGVGHGTAATLVVGLLALNTGIGYDDVRWWHRGVLTLAVVTALLLARLGRERRPQRRAVTIVLGLVLVGQLVASVREPGRGLWGDRPYSNARAAATAAAEVCGEGCTIVVDIDFRTSAVSAHLGGRPLYAVNSGRYSTYTVWGERTWYRPSWAEVQRAAAQFTRPVLVTAELRGAPVGWRLVAEFGGAVWADENFAVYVPDD